MPHMVLRLLVTTPHLPGPTVKHIALLSPYPHQHARGDIETMKLKATKHVCVGTACARVNHHMLSCCGASPGIKLDIIVTVGTVLWA